MYIYTGIFNTQSVQMKFTCEFIKSKTMHYLKKVQLLTRLSQLRVRIWIVIRNISIAIIVNMKAVSEHIVPLEICVPI